MGTIKVRVSTPQPKGRWRIGQQWWPEPREALVTPEELERLQADPLLKVIELEELDDTSDLGANGHKRLVGWPGSGALAKAGIETRGQLEAFVAGGGSLTSIEGIDETKAQAILGKLGMQ